MCKGISPIESQTCFAAGKRRVRPMQDEDGGSRSVPRPDNVRQLLKASND